MGRAAPRPGGLHSTIAGEDEDATASGPPIPLTAAMYDDYNKLGPAALQPAPAAAAQAQAAAAPAAAAHAPGAAAAAPAAAAAAPAAAAAASAVGAGYESGDRVGAAEGRTGSEPGYDSDL